MTKHTMQNCGTPITKLYCEDFCPDNCDKCQNWTPKKPETNYDRIVSMKPEALAIAICTDFGGIPWCKNIPTCKDTLCVGCVVKWLKQEITE